jgi:hypothetical protein
MYTNEEIKQSIDKDKASKERMNQSIKENEARYLANQAKWAESKVEEYLRKHKILASEEQKREMIKAVIEQIKEREH